MVARNPFKPTAGAPPPVLVGRDDVLHEFEMAIEDGPGAPGRLALITGTRGVGKTVMLTEVDRLAEAHGWVTIDETATPGIVERMILAIERLLEERPYGNAKKKRTVSGVTAPSILGVGGGGVTFNSPAERAATLQTALEALLADLDATESGLLITIDEVHSNQRAELRDIAAVAQLLIRDERNFAIVFAGLPSAVSDLLNDEVLTFLRRAERFLLEDVKRPDVRAAFVETITDNGYTIDDDALDIATEATGGYPFMIQLVGYHVWRKAVDSHIDVEAAREGVDAARVRLGNTVHSAALAGLSDVDRTYLVAMAQDDGPSSTGEVARRMGRATSYANIYRTRLIEAGIIEADGHGRVAFSIPYLRDYLREHAAQLGLKSFQDE